MVMVGVPVGYTGKRSMAGIEVDMCDSLNSRERYRTLSDQRAWHGAAVGDESYVRLIGTIARSSFRQKSQNLDSTKKGQYPKKGQLAPASF